MNVDELTKEFRDELSSFFWLEDDYKGKYRHEAFDIYRSKIKKLAEENQESFAQLQERNTDAMNEMLNAVAFRDASFPQFDDLLQSVVEQTISVPYGGETGIGITDDQYGFTFPPFGKGYSTPNNGAFTPMHEAAHNLNMNFYDSKGTLVPDELAMRAIDVMRSQLLDKPEYGEDALKFANSKYPKGSYRDGYHLGQAMPINAKTEPWTLKELSDLAVENIVSLPYKQPDVYELFDEDPFPYTIK